MLGKLCSIKEHKATWKPATIIFVMKVIFHTDHCKFMFEDLKKDSSGTSGTINLFEDASNLFGNEKPAEGWMDRTLTHLLGPQ